MKKTLTFLLFWVAFLSLSAQNQTLICSGIVTNSFNGSPIPNQSVIIHSDSLNGTSIYFYHTVLTDMTGLYYDSIPLPPPGNTGTVIIETMDCQNYLNVYTASYGPQNYTILHDFSICYSNTACSADFTAYPDSSSNYTFHFYPSYQANITTWIWDFGDGTSATITAPGNPNITHTFSDSAAVHTVCLSVQGVNSCTDLKCETITVNNSGCHANFTYSVSPNVSTPTLFTDLSTSSGSNIVSWFWNFGDIHSGSSNTSTLQNPSHTFSYPDTYNVCLTIQSSDSSCYDMICKSITVEISGGCQAYFIASTDSTSVPAGNPVQFTDLSSGNPTGWYWNFGDSISGTNNTSTLQNPTHIYNANGTYTVCLTISSNNCQDAYCRTIQVGTTPGCSSYFEYVATYLTATFHGFLGNNLPGGGVFTWSFGDSTGGQGQTITHTYAALGTYTVVMTAVDSSNCSSTYTQSVTLYDSIHTHQVYGQVFADNFPITSGLVMMFSLDYTPNYTPYFNVATIDSMGIYYFTMIPDGNYFLIAIPIQPAGYLPTYYGDVLEWQNATILQLGQPNNPYNIHLLTASPNTSGNGTINGQLNLGKMTSSIVDKVYMLLMNSDMQPINFYRVNSSGDFTFPTLCYGTYYLKAEVPWFTSDVVRVDISEENPIASVIMTFSGGRILIIDEPSSNLTAGNIYPNPVTDVVYLSLKTTKAASVQIDIYDMAGQVVIHAEKTLGSGETTIPVAVSSLSKGIYTLRVHSDKGINIIRKLVK